MDEETFLEDAAFPSLNVEEPREEDEYYWNVGDGDTEEEDEEDNLTPEELALENEAIMREQANADQAELSHLH